MTGALLTALSRHYIDAYAGLLPVVVVTFVALTTASGSIQFLAAWSTVRLIQRGIRKACCPA
ncbi:hypothetical protein [Salipiger marinus]|uniref:Uncharacterized protein n=1 Tax=Salipiger marinus TaxID=555512 RepID=A0A1G8UZC6_9RHOB|nr:hypothetical protein [Salipiger marinus]SDJ58954.1 hypothetical protein SAMN04487993_10575 [Salipiger marinus]